MGQISGMCNVNSDPNHSKTKRELTAGVYWSCLCSPAFFFFKKNTWFYISSVNYPCILKPSLWEGEPTLILPHGMESMRCSTSEIMYLPSRMLHCFSLNLKSSKEKMPVLSSHNRLAGVPCLPLLPLFSGYQELGITIPSSQYSNSCYRVSH